MKERLVNTWRFVRRVFQVALEKAQSAVLDEVDVRRTHPDPILRVEEGQTPMRDAHSVAVFVQFSLSGELTAMVRRQLQVYRSLGFAVVLVSNSPAFPETSWKEALGAAALVVHRRNRHLDFGAWKDLVPIVRSRWSELDELLLVNDSVLGPVWPLDGHFAVMRAGGPGFFGMLESRQGGAHLQSWLLLARGPKAVADLSNFLAALRLSRSKWGIVQRGELQLARAMHIAGNRVAAVFGYSWLVDILLRDRAQRAYLDDAFPGLITGLSHAAAHDLLMQRPLNPAHHLWRVLLERTKFPFIKTELLRNNPGRLPQVGDWSDLISSYSPTCIEELTAHLVSLGR